MHAEHQAGAAREGKTRAPARRPQTTTRTPLAGLVALQRSAGNAAVVQMLRQAGHPGAREEHRHGPDCDLHQTEYPLQRSTVHDVLRTPGRISASSGRFERAAEAAAPQAPREQQPSRPKANTFATTRPFSVQRANDDTATPIENQAQTPGQARSSPDNAAGLPTFAPGAFEFLGELEGGSSRPWHVRVGATDKVFKFSQRRGRTPLTPDGVPGPITVPKPGNAAESSAEGATQAKKSNSLPAEEIMLAEMLTGKIYQAAGAKVLPARFAWVATGNKTAAEWTLAQVTDFRTVDPDGLNAAQIAPTTDFLSFVGLDVVLAIFDLRKPPNWMKIGADLYRQDLGGAMDVSAQGAPKAPGDFVESTDVFKTIESMSTGPHSKGSPYAGVPLERFAESLIDLDKRLPPATIKQLVDASGLPETKRPKLIAALNNRISSGVAWARTYVEPVAMSGRQVSKGLDPDTEPDTEPDWANALTPDALDWFRDIHELGGQQRTRLKTVVTGWRDELIEAAGDSYLVATLRQLIDLIDADRKPSGLDRELDDTVQQLYDKIKLWPLEATPEPLRNLAQELSDYAYLINTEKLALNNRLTNFERSEQRSDDPSAAPTLVGPEELLNTNQYRAGMAEKLHDDLQRLQGKRLIRRVSKAEAGKYRIAAQAQNVDEAVEALFDTKGHVRGEIVFSVGDVYILSRERNWAAEVKAEAEKRSEGKDPQKNVPYMGAGYECVVEIPITPELLGFLNDYAYISAPASAKPNAFKPNPNVKYEGAAGGTGDGTGIPNVVVKKQGFGQFLAATRAITITDATESATMKRLWEKEVQKEVEILEKNARLKKNANKTAAEGKSDYELDGDDFFAGLYE